MRVQAAVSEDKSFDMEIQAHAGNDDIKDLNTSPPQPNLTFKQTVRLHMHRENLWYSGNYPNSRGKLNYVLAFGTGGGGGCMYALLAKQAGFNPIAPWKWLIWRVFVFCYLMAIFIYSIDVAWDGGRWFYYLTNWQTTLLFLYGTVTLASCVTMWVKYYDILHAPGLQASNAMLLHLGEYKLPWYLRATWIIQALGMNCGIWVFVMFWAGASTTLSPGEDSDQYKMRSLIDHFSTICLVVIDFSFSGVPWQLYQFLWSALFVIVYTVWTGIHFALNLGNKYNDGNYIYTALDWNHPVPTFFIGCALVFLCIPASNLLIWLYASEYCKRYVPWIPVTANGSTGGASFSNMSDVTMLDEATAAVSAKRASLSRNNEAKIEAYVGVPEDV